MSCMSLCWLRSMASPDYGALLVSNSHRTQKFIFMHAIVMLLVFFLIWNYVSYSKTCLSISSHWHWAFSLTVTETGLRQLIPLSIGAAGSLMPGVGSHGYLDINSFYASVHLQINWKIDFLNLNNFKTTTLWIFPHELCIEIQFSLCAMDNKLMLFAFFVIMY